VPQHDRAGRIRTVIVDDSRDVAFLLGVTMDLDGGFDVLGEAVDAHGGLALAMATQPDLVIVDLHLGRRDGVWLLRKLRAALGDRLALAVVTGADPEREGGAAMAAGADGVFSKHDMTTSLVGDVRALVSARTRRSALAG
jgi:DNA-binding NarL/FixJ family response regulator